jgi:hypothetical protein
VTAVAPAAPADPPDSGGPGAPPQEEVRLRPMVDGDRAEVADLIYVSTNYWYQTNGRPPIFSGGPGATELFADVYEALDPGCCVVAESGRSSLRARDGLKRAPLGRALPRGLPWGGLSSGGSGRGGGRQAATGRTTGVTEEPT